MGDAMRFIVLGTPITQGSMKSIGRGRMIHQNSKKLNAWRDLIASEFDKRKPADWCTTSEYDLFCIFYLKKPKKPAHEYPAKDLDKLIRAVGDALTEHAWEDDVQIVRLGATKMYAENDGVEIIITEIERV